jgi:hypothetical protein
MSDIDITNSSIHSDCFEENGFKFSHQDMRDEIFGPVIREIQANIRKVKEENCGNRISGIFISGAIGHGDYLKGIVDEEFGKDGVKVTSLHDSQFAVSKGLVACGFRNRGRMIPYYEGRNDLSKDKVINVDGRMFTDDDKNIDFSGLDYVIGLGKCSTFKMQ